MDFSELKKAYFLGIGGIGISSIARMFLLEGKVVSGSDTSSSLVTDELEKAGAKIFIGQDISTIPEDVDLVVYTIALENYAADFLAEVKQKFKNVISYPEALSVVSKNKYTIAVAGTHGKTTTTAMISKIIIDAGLDPTVIVGSFMKDQQSNFVAGKSKYLVVEACEYKRSFLNIHPTVAVITSIDADHLDYYKDMDDIENAFEEFVSKAECVVGDAKSSRISKVANGKKIIDSSLYFDGNMQLKIPGEHNRKNASCALAVAEFLGIPKNSALKSLLDFSGTWRRFEFKGKTGEGALVYDDYAHHPDEIRATLQGTRELYPDKKIIIAFQPHLFSRTKAHLNEFADELSKADQVVLLPIYPSREQFDPTISSRDILAKITNGTHIENFSEAAEFLQKFGSDNVILIMGAGNITDLASNLIK